MLKLFKNPSRHIGQRVLVWKGHAACLPIWCKIVEIEVSRTVQYSKMGRNQRSVSSSFVVVPTEDCDKSPFVAYLGDMYNNWNSWYWAVMYMFDRESVEGEAELYRMIIGLGRDIKAFEDAAEENKLKRGEQMNALMLHLEQGVQDLQRKRAILFRTSVCGDLWRSLDKKKRDKCLSVEARKKFKEKEK